MQWKARYIDGTEVWETPGIRTTDLDQSRIESFELVEDGMIKHRWELDPEFDERITYIRRTRKNILGGEADEVIYLVTLHTNDSSVEMTIYPDHTETVSV